MPKSKTFSWYWYLCAAPILPGLTLIFLALSGIIKDRIAEDGTLVEDGYHVFAEGFCLVKIGIAGVIIIILLKKIQSIYQYLKQRFFNHKTQI